MPKVQQGCSSPARPAPATSHGLAAVAAVFLPRNGSRSVEWWPHAHRCLQQRARGHDVGYCGGLLKFVAGNEGPPSFKQAPTCCAWRHWRQEELKQHGYMQALQRALADLRRWQRHCSALEQSEANRQFVMLLHSFTITLLAWGISSLGITCKLPTHQSPAAAPLPPPPGPSGWPAA